MTVKNGTIIPAISGRKEILGVMWGGGCVCVAFCSALSIVCQVPPVCGPCDIIQAASEVKQNDRQTYRQRDTVRQRQTDTETQGETDRQTDRQVGRQTEE